MVNFVTDDNERLPPLDLELVAMYRGESARITRLDVEILIMKYMGWSRSDLRDADSADIDRVLQHMLAEYEADIG